MHTPLPSVVALAHFELTGERVAGAIETLKQETDWQEWLNQVELHGLSGLANKHVAEHKLPIPEALHLQLKALKVRHTAAANARYQTLCEIDAIFSQRNIPYAALKGAALMPLLYQEGYLRPMRDMDLLLPLDHEQRAATCLRELGFDLPEAQPSKFMRDVHQLPNATKAVNGMLSSVELHHDGLARDVSEHVYYPSSADGLQTITWGELHFSALADVQMLHQVARHMEGLHPGGVMKLINAVDVVVLAERVLANGQWSQLAKIYPHVINTLRCLHLLTPLPQPLQQQLRPLPRCVPSGVGSIMLSLRSALSSDSKREAFKLLLLPSDWWMHLFYNVDPDKSLLMVKLIWHPLRVAKWLWQRAYSGLRGG